jgi:hypothetical protein
MQVNKGEALCEEFCDSFHIGTKLTEEDYLFKRIEEIKCILDSKFFPELMQRMMASGYCCTQVQKDAKKNKCTAWFEEKAEGV